MKDKGVINLSSKELSVLERSGLEKGLKFAIAPRKIPTAEIVAAYVHVFMAYLKFINQEFL